MPVLMGGGFRVPYTIDFTELSDGALPPGLTGATWAISSGAAINTPTLGNELILDGDIETAIAGKWYDNGTATTFEQSSEQAHSGTYSLKTISDALNEGPRQVLSVAQWNWYSIQGWVWLTSGSFRLGDQNGRIVNPPNVDAPTGEWGKWIQTGWAAVAGNIYAGALSRTAVSQFYIDDFSWKQITVPATMAASLPHSQTSNVIASITATIAPYAWIGLWICQDEAKTNGIMALSNGVQAALLKMVDGTLSQVIVPTAAAIGAGLEVRKSGSTVKLFSNSIQVGTDQTISDTSIIGNTIHGPMNTHPDNKLLTLSVLPN